MKKLAGCGTLMATGLLVLVVVTFIFSFLAGVTLSAIDTFAPGLHDVFLRWLSGDSVEDWEWTVGWREDEKGVGVPPDCNRRVKPTTVATLFPAEGYTPNHPVQDFFLPVGAPVVSPVNGRVVWAGPRLKGYGLMVVVREGDTDHVLAPLTDVQVTAGDDVRQGHLLGRVAPAPEEMTPVLRYAVYRQGRAVDPMRVLEAEDPCVLPPPGDAPPPDAAARFRRPITARARWQLPKNLAAWGVSAPMDEEERILARAMYRNRPLYVWPAGHPELAQKGGIQVKGVRTVVVGPRPGKAWARWETTPGSGVLISVMEEK